MEQDRIKAKTETDELGMWKKTEETGENKQQKQIYKRDENRKEKNTKFNSTGKNDKK